MALVAEHGHVFVLDLTTNEVHERSCFSTLRWLDRFDPPLSYEQYGDKLELCEGRAVIVVDKDQKLTIQETNNFDSILSPFHLNRVPTPI